MFHFILFLKYPLINFLVTLYKMDWSTIFSYISCIVTLVAILVIVYIVVQVVQINNDINKKQANKPTIAPRTYFEYPNTDFPGVGDLGNQPGTFASCQPICDAMANCSGFTFDGTNCYFKNTSLLTTPVYKSGMQFWYTGNMSLEAATAPSTRTS